MEKKLLQGNEACVYGALYAGMNFYSGYPITPSTEIAEVSAVELPKYGGRFIQMEDEIAGLAAAIGASIVGAKALTATSGPGFSLKQENLGYAAIAEIPCVIVNVQRTGPSTGLPTSPGQGDYMQAKWGTHGDHPVIAISPTSVLECFEFTVKAFNFAEKYRTPVILLMDEIVGHLREGMIIPQKGELEVIDRAKVDKSIPILEYKPYENTQDLVPPLSPFGEGYRYNITGLFHDEFGFPTNDTKIAGAQLNRIMAKIDNNLEDILIYEEYMLDDAEIMIVSFGGVARAAKDAVLELREAGVKAGVFIPKTVWPFPELKLAELCKKINKVVVAELNMGQMILEVKRVVKDNVTIEGVLKADGDVIYPYEIINKCKEVVDNV